MTPTRCWPCSCNPNPEQLSNSNHEQTTQRSAQQVQQLGATYDKRVRANLIYGYDRQILDLNLGMVDRIRYYTYWYEPSGQCLRLAAVPDTLSGDILSPKQNPLWKATLKSSVTNYGPLKKCAITAKLGG